MLTIWFPQKNVHSKQFVGYMCDHVLPLLKEVVSPDEETNIQLEVLKTFAEISEFAGDMEKLDTRLNTIFTALLVSFPSQDNVEFFFVPFGIFFFTFPNL